MKQIKTVVGQIEGFVRFDNPVNALIADGWVLIKRKIIFHKDVSEAFSTYGYPVLYAELEKETPYFEEVTE